jgi:hypothetical protein
MTETDAAHPPSASGRARPKSEVSGSEAAAKKAVILAADAMRVSAAYRLLHRDNGRKLPVVL